MPTPPQQKQLKQFSGACRFVFNRALALQQERFEAKEKLSYVDLAKLLTQWRREEATSWLKDPPTHVLQHTLKHLEAAFTNFFAGRACLPRFKKKSDSAGVGLRFPDRKHLKLDARNGRIFLPKFRWIRYRNSREVLGEIRNATVVQDGEKWMLSVQAQREVDVPAVSDAEPMLGIDVGIAHFATLSTGEVIESVHSLRQHRRQLVKAQRAMSRKSKFSQNWRKAKAKVTKTYRKIRNVRQDFLHKTTTHISKNHAKVCIEDLQIVNMSRSSKGTREQPAVNVAQKRGLNRSILDQGWGEFRRQLAYKLAWRGGTLVLVAPQFTSQTCPKCQHVSAENRTTQARFRCVNCGFSENADVVAASNILERGHRSDAWEFEGSSLNHPVERRTHVGRSLKQEPAEATLAVARTP